MLTFDFAIDCRSSLVRLRRMVTFLLVGCLMSIAQVRAPQAVDLEGVDLHGKQVSLSHAREPQVTVLIFVRTDCPITNRYAPTLQKLAADYAGKANFWLIYPDNSESTAQIERYLRDYQYKGFAIARDPEHVLVKLSRAQIMPEAAVFDSSSRLLYHGRIDNWFQSFAHPRPQPTTHELDDAIRAALQGKSVAVPETKAVGCYISDVE